MTHDLSKDYREAFWETTFPFASVTDKHLFSIEKIKTLKRNKKKQFEIPMPEKKKCTKRDNFLGTYCLLFTEKRMHTIENV